MQQASMSGAYALLFLTVMTSACDRSDQLRADTPDATAPVVVEIAPMPPSSMAETSVLIEFDAAHESFVRRDIAKAGIALRSAGSKLKDAAEKVPGDASEALNKSAAAVDRAAADVRAGTIKSVDVLDRRLAAVNASLSRVHHKAAMKAWSARESSTTGHHLRMAVDEFENGTKRLGRDIKGGTATVIRDARRVADALAQRIDVSAVDVERSMQGLGREIEKLAKDATSKPR
jgi:hypothetical protein